MCFSNYLDVRISICTISYLKGEGGMGEPQSDDAPGKSSSEDSLLDFVTAQPQAVAHEHDNIVVQQDLPDTTGIEVSSAIEVQRNKGHRTSVLTMDFAPLEPQEQTNNEALLHLSLIHI